MTSYDFDTPMMQQYMEIKKAHPDCVLFFRLGDFYEMFLDDAILGAEVLNITLTSRSRGRDGRIPMAGVPYHAVGSYLAKMVRNGHKVAICEQVSEPNGKDLVRREVVRIVTPGTVLDENNLEQKENNYILSLSLSDGFLAIAAADISTGDFQTAQFPADNVEALIVNELARFRPSECVLPQYLYNDANLLKTLNSSQNISIFPFSDWEVFSDAGGNHLKRHFGVKTLAGYSLDGKKHAQAVSSALLGYLKHTQKDKVQHLKTIKYYSGENHVALDRSTITNLELFKTIRDGEKRGSLVTALDKTSTPMGGRLLRTWIVKPLMEKKLLLERYEAVEILLNSRSKRKKLRTVLQELGDVERVLSRLATGLGNARDLILLKDSFNKIYDLKENLKEFDVSLIKKIEKQISKDVKTVSNSIEKTILSEPPHSVREGGFILEGVDKRLDELRSKMKNSKDWLVSLETQEKKRTGISTLKVKFNKVFGYYIEISNSNLDSVPNDYIRKQTLVNAERFITPELKKHEDIILLAEEETVEIEYKIFLQTVDKILESVEGLQLAAQAVATLDVLLAFAELAEKNKYVKPELVNTGEINITDGRHPVVEQLLEEADFVPNDTKLNHTDHQLLLVTGPNMAGKSVYLRQVALITLMAQIGCFVPAKKAQISLVDRIFVRSGAADVITSGLSTFMVEMVETAYILNNSTKNSLIVMDEIGRGTSTYDGISIAWSVAEYLVTHTKAKSLFATHYHELQDLADEYEQIKNYQVAVKEDKDKLIFIHKVIEGGASHSHGVKVAALAGVPKEVTKKATEVLHGLEKRSKKDLGEVSKLEKKIKELDVENMSPLEALQALADLQKLV